MIKRIISALRRRLRRPVVVQTYKVKEADWIKLHFAKHRQLAEELGRKWPETR